MALHLHDNDGQTSVEGRKDQHRLPFDGTIDWRVTMKKIARLGYSGSICLEVKNFFYDAISIEAFLKTAFERAQKLENLREAYLQNPKND